MPYQSPCRGVQVQRLPVFYKQRDNLFYPVCHQRAGCIALASHPCVVVRADCFHAVQVWAFVLPVTLLRLPYSLLEAVIWTVITYFAIGFAPDAGRVSCASLLSAGQASHNKREIHEFM